MDRLIAIESNTQAISLDLIVNMRSDKSASTRSEQAQCQRLWSGGEIENEWIVTKIEENVRIPLKSAASFRY